MEKNCYRPVKGFNNLFVFQNSLYENGNPVDPAKYRIFAQNVLWWKDNFYAYNCHCSEYVPQLVETVKEGKDFELIKVGNIFTHPLQRRPKAMFFLGHDGKDYQEAENYRKLSPELLVFRETCYQISPQGELICLGNGDQYVLKNKRGNGKNYELIIRQKNLDGSNIKFEDYRFRRGTDGIFALY